MSFTKKYQVPPDGKSDFSPTTKSENNKKYHRRYYYRGNRNKSIICSNCSGKGHLFKDCKKPIQSYGVLGWTLLPIDPAQVIPKPYSTEPTELLSYFKYLFRTNKYKLHVCLIQRRHTISYEAFIRGKYDLDELEMHQARMTVDERRMIRELSWDSLYEDIMHDKPTPNKSTYFVKERERAKSLYDEVDIDEFLDEKNYTEVIEEPTWEFPKGRRFVHETDQQCALREFEEETGIRMQDTTIIMLKDRPDTPLWIKENFCGMNKRFYHNKYILALIDPNSRGPFLDPNDSGQTSEVNDTKYFTFDAARDIIHSFHPEKREALKRSYRSILKLLSS